MSAPLTVDFYLGLGSRYSYLAATQLDRIESKYRCRFIWKPIASGALIGRRGGNPFHGEPVSGQYDWAYREQDARAWADFYGVPFTEPKAFRKDPTAMALACLAADAQDALEPCCRLIHRMVFVDGLQIDDAAIESIPDGLGIDPNRFHRDMAATETAARHERLIDEAHARGAFGVPTFFLGGRMFWGNDRLVLLEAALAGR